MIALDKAMVAKSLVNENVEGVVNCLKRYCERNSDLDVCVCEECLMDIIAIALNNLKPRYRLICRHMHKDRDTVKKTNAEIEEAIENALEFVKKHPHH